MPVRERRDARGQGQHADDLQDGQQPVADVVVVVGRGEPAEVQPGPPDGEEGHQVAEHGRHRRARPSARGAGPPPPGSTATTKQRSVSSSSSEATRPCSSGSRGRSGRISRAVTAGALTPANASGGGRRARRGRVRPQPTTRAPTTGPVARRTLRATPSALSATLRSTASSSSSTRNAQVGPGPGDDRADRAQLEAGVEDAAQRRAQGQGGGLQVVRPGPRRARTGRRRAGRSSGPAGTSGGDGVGVEPVEAAVDRRGRQALVAEGEHPVVAPPGQRRGDVLAAAAADRGAAEQGERDVAAELGRPGAAAPRGRGRCPTASRRRAAPRPRRPNRRPGPRRPGWPCGSTA